MPGTGRATLVAAGGFCSGRVVGSSLALSWRKKSDVETRVMMLVLNLWVLATSSRQVM